MHCGAKLGRLETTKNSLSHELGSEWVSERCEQMSKRANRRACGRVLMTRFVALLKRIDMMYNVEWLVMNFITDLNCYLLFSLFSRKCLYLMNVFFQLWALHSFLQTQILSHSFKIIQKFIFGKFRFINVGYEDPSVHMPWLLLPFFCLLWTIVHCESICTCEPDPRSHRCVNFR